MIDPQPSDGVVRVSGDMHKDAQPSQSGGWLLLPAAPGTCQECATSHDPNQPHNQQSMFYQYHFLSKNGRWPTWDDAMTHCDDAMKKAWTDELLKRGVKVRPDEPQ